MDKKKGRSQGSKPASITFAFTRQNYLSDSLDGQYNTTLIFLYGTMYYMTGTELRIILEDLGMLQAELARLLGVTPRAVNLWATEKRSVPRAVIAYLGLFKRMSTARQAQEILRVRA